jgi:hypothetical protein
MVVQVEPALQLQVPAGQVELVEEALDQAETVVVPQELQLVLVELEEEELAPPE